MKEGYCIAWCPLNNYLFDNKVERYTFILQLCITICYHILIGGHVIYMNYRLTLFKCIIVLIRVRKQFYIETWANVSSSELRLVSALK